MLDFQQKSTYFWTLLSGEKIFMNLLDLVKEKEYT